MCNVHFGSTRWTLNRRYAFAVLNAYVYTKKSRQKTNAEIHQKLAFLEGDVWPTGVHTDHRSRRILARALSS